MRHHYIVSYDIADPTRLRKVHRTVRDFGDAIQLSVFACQLSERDLATLQARLEKVVTPTQDQILFIKLGKCREDDEDDGPPRCETLGRPLTPGMVRCIVI
jgi:CRISPR-associated protein Cas2